MRARNVLGILAGASAAGAFYAVRKVDQRMQLTEHADTSGAPFGEASPIRPKLPTGNGRVLPPRWEPAPITAAADWVPEPLRHPAARIVGYLWALPMTLIGLLAGIASRTTPEVRDGVLLFTEASGPMAALLRYRGFNGTALGHVVITRGVPSDALLAHELVHVRQAERLGPLFGPLYLVLLAIYGYTRHPMERAARTGARTHLT